jgi:hypothetical protein
VFRALAALGHVKALATSAAAAVIIGAIFCSVSMANTASLSLTFKAHARTDCYKATGHDCWWMSTPDFCWRIPGGKRFFEISWMRTGASPLKTYSKPT